MKIDRNYHKIMWHNNYSMYRFYKTLLINAIQINDQNELKTAYNQFKIYTDRLINMGWTE